MFAPEIIRVEWSGPGRRLAAESGPSRQPQSFPCEAQAAPDVLVLHPELFLARQLADAGQRTARAMVAHERKGPSEVASGEVGEGRPVFLREARHPQRIAGDHLDIEPDLRPGGSQDPDGAGQVEDARTE